MSPCLTLSPILIALPEENSGGATLVSQFHAVGFPEMQAGQFAVLNLGVSEISRESQDDGDMENRQSEPWIFNSFNHARAFALQAVAYYPAQQCLIFDADWQHVHTVQNGQPIPLEELLARQPGAAKAWWQIWK